MNSPARPIQELSGARPTSSVGLGILLTLVLFSAAKSSAASSASVLTNLQQLMSLPEAALRYSNYEARVQGVVTSR